MKRIIILGLFLSSTIFFVQAQKINGGLIGGLSASQVDGDQMGGYNQLGACLGAFLEMPLGSDFYFEPELRFCQKGSTGYLGTFYLNAHLNYVELPLLCNWQYKKVKLETGLVPAVLLNTTVGDNIETSDLKRLDVGFAGGLSYMATNTIRFNVRYTHTIPFMYRYENNCVTVALFYYLKNEKSE